MRGITRRQIIRYTVFPEVKPRMQELFLSGFRQVPYLMALVYQVVRLLPSGHPYLNPANAGKFGVRHVIAEAANNLVISRKNIDQIFLFVTILLGIMLVFVQMGLLAFSIIAPAAMAAMPTNFQEFFVTPAANRAQDIAYIFLDMTFGIPDMFLSCVDPGANEICLDYDKDEIRKVGGGWILSSQGWPYPIHKAMHQTFQFYSIGLLVVAALITSYFVATIVIETAQTGTAFGKRFNKVWAPIRIVMAFGLLVPVGHGLNSAQYIVLYAAKFGSGFATNGWTLFNDTLTEQTFLGPTSNLVSRPNVPEVGNLLQFLYAAKICKILEAAQNPPRQINAYLVGDPLGENYMLFPQTGSYNQMIAFANGSSQLLIRFGDPDYQSNPGSRASIAATCGEIAVPLIDARLPGSDNPPEPGPVEIQKQYLNIIYNFWNLDDYVDDYAMATVSRYTSLMGGGGDLPPPKWKIDNFMEHRGELEETFTDAKTAQENDPRWSIDPFMIKRGWAAAGVWYNKIAQLNGSMTAAAYAVPNVSRYPEVMERVLNAKKQQAEVISPDTRFEPVMPGGGREWTTDPIDRQKAKAMWEGFNYWQSDGHVSSTHTDPSGSPVGDAINALLGTEGLYDMVKNADIHPLAQLVGIGRALVESAVRNLGLSAAASVGGAIGGTLSKLVGDIGDVGIGFFMSMATLGLATGFIMFYIIPFMPFIYFFFAVGAWIKTIFEAMVGAPLWALAHIRIDGPGLPGKAAIGGYFLIFEIFLRPILIIFGLLASITIFAALISTLNEIWSMVTYNVGGFNPVENMNGNAMDYFRSPLDELFFTVVYAVIAYLMGMSSFKLIDLIPSKILRWMGRNDTIFSDNREDAGQFIGTAYVGADQAIKPIFGGLQGVMSSFGKPNRGGGAS